MHRVRIDGRMFLGRMHGIARYSYSLAETVARLRPEWRVEVLERQGAFAELGRRHPNLHPLPVRAGPLSLREQWELPRALAGPGLFHATSIAVPAAYRGPLIVTVPDLIPFHLPRRSWQRIYRLYFEAVLRPACLRAQRVVAISAAAADDIAHSLRVPREKIAVIHLGKEEHFSPGPSPSPQPHFLCVANPKPHKNVPLLLDAFARYGGPEELVLVCPDAPWLSARLAGMPRVRRVFPVSEEELAALYRGALALVFPSYFEGFGLPALEAMACGTPVIAADATSLPEVVGDGGWLFPPHDSRELLSLLERVSQHPSEREEVARRALARAALFSWERAAQEHLALYEAVG